LAPVTTGEHANEQMNHASEHLFEHVLVRFVQPEWARRKESGQPVDDFIVRFQVLLHAGRDPEVRLNDEVGGTMLDDMGCVKRYEPSPEDAGVPHVTWYVHRNGARLAFNFRRGDPRRFEYLAHGNDFAATAREALAAGRIGVALDNAFSAVELLAMGELLSCRATIGRNALDARSHRAEAYNLWGRLDNTDPRFVRLLNRLRDLRSAARYLRGELALKDGETDELFTLLAKMEAHVRRVAEGDDADGGLHGFNVIATRELTDGQLVTDSDYTLRPASVRTRNSSKR
jgi:hypothetical protein